MNAALLYRRALESGVSIRLVEGVVKVTGSNEAVTALVPEMRQHKSELIAFLQQAHITSTSLMEAAMRACDYFYDTDAAREQMRLDCTNTPVHLRADLLDHFIQNYPKEKNAN